MPAHPQPAGPGPSRPLPADPAAPVGGGALVLVGRGRYADPWHDDAAAAQAVGHELAVLGVPHRVRGTAPHVLDGLEAAPALVVVLAGHGRPDPGFDGDDTAWAGFHDGLAALVRGGVPLLGLHQAANTFADSPHWTALLGGRWIEGHSMHPPIGEASFAVADPSHPVTTGLGDVVAVDEQYCDLVVDPASAVLVTTRHGGRDHPVVWTATAPPGAGRVVYDGLGHDVRSYASASRRALLRRELAWLLGRSPAGAAREDVAAA